MRPLPLLCAAFVGLFGALPILLFACGGNDTSAPGPSDASEASPEASVVEAAPDIGVIDGNVVHCELSDKTDPVAFCLQKIVLGALHNAAFAPAKRVAWGWASTPGIPDKDDGCAHRHRPELIKQEVSQERFIPIPDAVRDIYRL
jgi:hypothetical protein